MGNSVRGAKGLLAGGAPAEAAQLHGSAPMRHCAGMTRTTLRVVVCARDFIVVA